MNMFSMSKFVSKVRLTKKIKIDTAMTKQKSGRNALKISIVFKYDFSVIRIQYYKQKIYVRQFFHFSK